MTSTPTATARPTETTQVESSMFAVHGVGVVNGIAIGRAIVMGTAALEVPHYYIDTQNICAELKRFKRAIKQVQAELQAQIDALPADAPRELEPLLNVHRLLLDDHY